MKWNTKNDCLDVEKRYEIEVNTFQQRVNRIQSELDKATNDMKKHLAEYKNLMNVKQSLEKVLVRNQNTQSQAYHLRKSIRTEHFSKAKKAVYQRWDQVFNDLYTLRRLTLFKISGSSNDDGDSDSSGESQEVEGDYTFSIYYEHHNRREKKRHHQLDKWLIAKS